MAWPLSQDYNEALQNPQTSFSDPDLRQGQVVTNAIGLPAPCTGNFADVYAVESADRKAKWAVKCFTREVRGLRERYSAISKYLQQVHLPFTVDFQYLQEGIRVGGRWYPVVKMHWVEGFALNVFVRNTLDRPATLDALLRIWARMAQRLRESNLAHCDIQHGNVLLVPGSSAQSLAVKLIDYDGMWVPALAKTPSGEAGHPAYQHPLRIAERAYTPTLDRFPLLVVATALRALSVAGRSLWDRFEIGDNFLFRASDFLSPNKSPLFHELLKHSDPMTRKLAGHMLDALKGPLDAVPDLDEVLADVSAPAVPAGMPPLPGASKSHGSKSGVSLEPSPTTDFADLAEKSSPRARYRRQKKSRTGLVVAGAVLLLSLVGVGGYFAVNRASSRPAPAVADNQGRTPRPDTPAGPKNKSGEVASGDSQGTKPNGKAPVHPQPVKKSPNKVPPKNTKPEQPEPKTQPPKKGPDPLNAVARKTDPPAKKPTDPPAKKPADPPVKPPAPEPSPEPKTPAERKAAEALAPLREQLRKPGADLEKLRHELYVFRFAHPNTPATLEANRLLASLRSPLDALEPEKIPEVEKITAQPLDLVGIVGEHRGRHGGMVQCLAYSTDGKYVVSSGTGLTRIWDAETMHLRSVMTYPETVLSISLTRDANLLAVGGIVGEVQVWDIKNKDLPINKATIKPGGPVNAVALHPEGKLLAVGCSNGRMRVYEMTEDGPQETANVEAHSGGGGVMALAYASNGTWLASGGGDQAVRLWSFDKGKARQPLLLGELLGGPVMSLAFSPDDKLLAAGGQNNCSRLWVVPPPKSKPRPPQPLPSKGNWLCAMSFSNTGKMLAAAGGDGIVRLWRVTPGGNVQSLAPLVPPRTQAPDGKPGGIFGVAFSPAGKRLVTGGYDQIVRSWDTTTATWVERFKPTSARTLAYSAAFSPDGKLLVTGAEDSSVYLFDLTRYPFRSKLLSYDGAPVYSVAFSPDGTLVAAGNQRGTLKQWLVSTGGAKASCTNHPGVVGAIAYLPDSKRILTLSGKSLVLWDGTNGKELRRFTGHTTPLGCMALSPDGKLALSGAGAPKLENGKPVVVGGKPVFTDSDLFVWDVDKGEKLFALPAQSRIHSAAFSADGQHLFCGAEEAQIRHWEMVDGKPVERKPLIGENQSATRLLATLDGRNVLSFGLEGHLQLRDAIDGQFSRQWQFPEFVGDIALSPEGRHVAITLGTGVVYILRLDDAAKEP